MKVYIDGENCRKGLVRVLLDSGIITGSREMTSYPIRALLEDVLGSEGLDINYYASKIKLPNGYQPSPSVMQHVHQIQEYTRKWVPSLGKQTSIM